MKTKHTTVILILGVAATSCRSHQTNTIQSETSSVLTENVGHSRSLIASDSALIHAVVNIDSAEIILTVPAADSLIPPLSARIRASGITLGASRKSVTEIQGADSVSEIRSRSGTSRTQSASDSETAVSAGNPMHYLIIPALIVLLLMIADNLLRRHRR